MFFSGTLKRKSSAEDTSLEAMEIKQNGNFTYKVCKWLKKFCIIFVIKFSDFQKITDFCLDCQNCIILLRFFFAGSSEWTDSL